MGDFMKTDLGLVHIITGDGKGKTTTSLGIAFRAAGHNLKVAVIQFLKGGSYIGEYMAAQKFPNILWKQFGKNCTYLDERLDTPFECGSCRDCFLNDEEAARSSREAVKFAKEIAATGEYDLIILDEANVAVSYAFVQPKELIELIKSKSPKTELIITGRGAHEEVMKLADYVSEVKKVKHPIDKGVYGRWGVEY